MPTDNNNTCKAILQQKDSLVMASKCGGGGEWKGKGAFTGFYAHNPNPECTCYTCTDNSFLAY